MRPESRVLEGDAKAFLVVVERHRIVLHNKGYEVPCPDRSLGVILPVLLVTLEDTAGVKSEPPFEPRGALFCPNPDRHLFALCDSEVEGIDTFLFYSSFQIN